MTETKYLSMSELSALLGVSNRTLTRMLSDGKLPKPTKSASLNRWPSGLIERWLAAGSPPVEVRARVAPRGRGRIMA
jgi:predicted DNA-binding transcriptional regulator AlpA